MCGSTAEFRELPFRVFPDIDDDLAANYRGSIENLAEPHVANVRLPQLRLRAHAWRLR
jgi:hypothetical protein